MEVRMMIGDLEVEVVGESELLPIALQAQEGLLQSVEREKNRVLLVGSGLNELAIQGQSPLILLPPPLISLPTPLPFSGLPPDRPR